MKNLVNKMKAKIINSKIGKWIGNIKTKIINSKVGNKTKETINEVSNEKNKVKQQTESIAVAEVVRNIYSRFVKFFEKFSKKFKKYVTFENFKDGDKINNFSYYMRKLLRFGCILLTIGFACLVLYAIKDIFLQVLITIATVAATVVCVEFIMTVLSVATGKAI